jgi:hypothetical protein
MKISSLVAATALAAFAWVPPSGRAQSTAKPETQVPNPLQALTRALAGKWRLDVRYEAVPFTGNKVVTGAGEESWTAGPGGITLIEQEHIPSANGNTFLMGLIWWDRSKNRLAGIECNSDLPTTCDLEGGISDISLSWDGRKFQIDEQETHDGRRMVWHEYWTDITADSFTQTGDFTEADGTTTRYMTVHGSRVKTLGTIGGE